MIICFGRKCPVVVSTWLLDLSLDWSGPCSHGILSGLSKDQDEDALQTDDSDAVLHLKKSVLVCQKIGGNTSYFLIWIETSTDDTNQYRIGRDKW